MHESGVELVRGILDNYINGARKRLIRCPAAGLAAIAHLMGDLHNVFHRLKIPPLRVGKSSGHGGWGQPHRFGDILESNPLGLWIFGQPVLLARHTKWTRTGPLKIAALAIFGNNVVVRTFARYPLVT